MDLKLELLPAPVTDVDRAKAFYADQLGFAVDVDNQPMEGIRVVELTPPGSACSIMVGTGITRSEPGSLQGPQLVVDDIEAAREELAGRGVDVSPVQHFEEKGLVEGKGGRWNSLVFFSDPDGNGWALQERPAPTPDTEIPDPPWQAANRASDAFPTSVAPTLQSESTSGFDKEAGCMGDQGPSR